MYYALRDGGPDAAVARYRELKEKNADEYEFSMVQLLVIGDKLVEKERLPEAIRMLDLGLEEFPDDAYAYYVNYDLSRAYKDLGNKDEAIRFCRKSIELNPDFKAGEALLAELEKM
jgi:tetratricopeptide (TPR) repeat protein